MSVRCCSSAVWVFLSGIKKCMLSNQDPVIFPSVSTINPAIPHPSDPWESGHLTHHVVTLAPNIGVDRHKTQQLHCNYTQQHLNTHAAPQAHAELGTQVVWGQGDPKVTSWHVGRCQLYSPIPPYAWHLGQKAGWQTGSTLRAGQCGKSGLRTEVTSG